MFFVLKSERSQQKQTFGHHSQPFQWIKSSSAASKSAAHSSADLHWSRGDVVVIIKSSSLENKHQTSKQVKKHNMQ